MKLLDLLNIATAIDHLKDQQLPFGVAFKIYKLGSKLAEMTGFYQQQLRSLIQTYGELDEHGAPLPGDEPDTYRLKPETQDECAQKMNELLAMDVDCEYTFTIDELSNAQLTPQDINKLSALIV